jgi:tungstate transport system substrate-binding protein
MRATTATGRRMARGALFAAVLLVGVGLQPKAFGQASRDVVLATTTSVRDAGLLASLLPTFESATGYRVKVIAVGSGQAMELGRRGEADVFLLHDPAGEERFVAEGYGIDRRPLMHNEFLLIGPPSDPAKARGADILSAFRAIAKAEAPFVSRGDRSGTNARELALWKAVGIEPAEPWYRETGQGMGATLVVTDQLRAYTLTDVATFLSHRSPLALDVICQGDSLLRNVYHVIRANPDRFKRVNVPGALAFADYMVSDSTQRLIGEFRQEELGRSIFVPDAERKESAAQIRKQGASPPRGIRE